MFATTARWAERVDGRAFAGVSIGSRGSCSISGVATFVLGQTCMQYISLGPHCKLIPIYVYIYHYKNERVILTFAVVISVASLFCSVVSRDCSAFAIFLATNSWKENGQNP